MEVPFFLQKPNQRIECRKRQKNIHFHKNHQMLYPLSFLGWVAFYQIRTNQQATIIFNKNCFTRLMTGTLAVSIT